MSPRHIRPLFIALIFALLMPDAAQSADSQWHAASNLYPDASCPWVLGDTATPEAPTLSGGVLTLSTSPASEFLYYEQTSSSLSIPSTLTISARLRVVSESHLEGNPRRGVAITFAVAPDQANFLWFGRDTVFIWSAYGVQGPTALVDTDNTFHTYDITVVDQSTVTVRQDGVQVLTGSIIGTGGEVTAPRIWWGDGTSSSSATSEWVFFRHNANTTECGTPSLSIDNVAVTEGNSGTVNATFTVSLSSPTDEPVTVNYATANGTATAGSDYVAGSGSLTIPANASSTTVTVVVNGDLLDEANETFFVNLSGAANATIADGQGQGTITGDDLPPFMSIDDVAVMEGNSGTVNATFTVSLSSPSGRDVYAGYTTLDASATEADNDYLPDSGVLTIPAQTLSTTVTVTVNCDLAQEPAEYFYVLLSGDDNAIITDGQGQCTIYDDDGPMPSMSISDVMVTERNGTSVNASFLVSLSHAFGQPVTVSYATANGTATAGADYVAASGTLTIPVNTASKALAVVVSPDLVDEDDETFFVDLSGAVNATIADGQGQGTIIDGYPSLSISNATVIEGNSGTVNATFTVSLPNPTPQVVAVNYATADGTATAANNDYVPTSGSLTIPANTLSTTVTVAVNGDLTSEGTERFFVDLSGAVNASVADGQGTGIIVDNDSGPGSLGLAWNDTPTYGSQDRGFACNANSGLHVLFGSFTAPTSMYFDGMTAEIDVTSDGPLPDWWRFGLGQCRSGPGTSFDFFSGPENAINPYPEPPQGSASYAVVGPNRACIRVQCTMPAPGILDSNVEYYLFKVIINNLKTIGTGSCPGCSTPVCLTLSSVRLHGAEGSEDVEIFGPDFRNFAMWQGGTPECPTLPFGTVSINDVSVTEGSSGTSPMTFTLTRNNSGCEQIRRTVAYGIVPASATPGSDYVAASGTAVFEAGNNSVSVNVAVNGDATVEPNETFLVQLGNPRGLSLADAEGVGTILNDDGSVGVPSEPGATVPRVSPNPFRDGVEISFALASGGLVRLEVYDLGGRRVRASPGTYFPAGPQTLSWDGRGDDGSAQPSGVYSLRLSGPGIALTRRVVRVN